MFSLRVPLFWLVSLSTVLASDDGISPRQGVSSTNFQALVTAHGLLCALGFAVLLPGGALLARYLRTSRPWWYTGHWIAQAAAAGPVIIIGIALGFASSSQAKKNGENTKGDPHNALGSVLLYLYIMQCIFGAVIHYWKPKSAARRRPPQNYLHAVLGITIFVLGMYQLHLGFDDAWPKYVGRGALPGAVGGLWVFWCIAIALAYTAGLWFLPKQYKQEAAGRIGRAPAPRTTYPMSAIEEQP